MARLIYSAIMSLDGYTADADGRFEWAAPDEEVHAFVNELERPAGTYLYGPRMYQTMRSGKMRIRSLASHPSRSTSRGSGRRPTRSSIPPPSRRRTPPGPASSGTSTRSRSAS